MFVMKHFHKTFCSFNKIQSVPLPGHSEVQRNSQRITCRTRNESNLENAIPGTAAEKIGCARSQAHN